MSDDYERFRLWFDKADGRTTYGVYPDQRFYAMQYEGDQREEVDALRSIVEGFSEWCKVNYLSKRQGLPEAALPEELLQYVRKEAKRGKSKAKPDSAEG